MNVILSVLLIFWTLPAWAGELFLWSPGPNYPQMVLYSRAPGGEKAAVEHYLASAAAEPELASLLKPGALAVPTGAQSPLEASSDRRLLILENRFEDLASFESKTRIQNLVNRFAANGVRVLLRPPVADEGLRPEEIEDFNSLLRTSSDGVLALGGGDVAPKMYGQAANGAKDFNLHRDQSEARVIRAFLADETKPVFGICRGAQLCAVVSGHELNQDIVSSVDHRVERHPIRIVPGTFLDGLFPEGEVEVNSLHHQAILPKEETPLRVAAESVEPDAAVVEAMEFKDRPGALIQFHPELMHDEVGDRILRWMADQLRGGACTRALRERLRAISSTPTS